MNEWRGALGAYVQKLGEYDCLSDDDEKEPALRAELLSTVLKSGTVSSRGAWGDKDWSQPQWLVLAPSRCDGEGGVAADPFLAALRDFPGDDGSSFDELEVWRVSLARRGRLQGARDEDQLETIEEASDEESDEGSRRAADVEKSPDDDARRRRAAEKSARWAVSARSPIRDDPEALEDIYAEASASGVGVDDLAALVHALHDARRSRRDDDSLDDVSTCVEINHSRATRGSTGTATRARFARSALRAAAPGDDREAIFQAIAALAVEAPRLTEAEETIVMTARAKVLALDRRDAVVRAVKDAADDEDASLDKLREALTYAKELPRTADVVRLEARLEARVVLETKREAARARVRGDDGGGDDSATGLLLRAQRWTDALAECEAAELPPDELRAVARKRDAYAAGAAALDARRRAPRRTSPPSRRGRRDASRRPLASLVAKRKIAALRAGASP
ncbi:hypothetical protein JL720_12868 [Aureococcus anophagefferens]|nr:hypothetical protein JL720_12868 [Aureococcus anophagefferens]